MDEREVSLMARGKFEEWLTVEGLLKLEAWARDGLTDEQIASNMGIRRETLYDWKKKYPNISNTLKKGKEIIDIQVENALLQKALGINKTIQKPVKIKEVLFDSGKKIRESECIEYVEEEIYIPPDTTAQIFWLKNRKPSIWRDKQSVEANVTINNPYEGLTTDELKKMINDG